MTYARSFSREWKLFSYHWNLIKLYRNGAFFNKILMKHIQRKNNSKVFSILQNVAAWKLTNCLGNSLLHYAAKYGNDELARYLIDLGAAVDAPNRRHQTPLSFAVDGAQEATAMLLVEANADPFQRDVDGQCPLARAFQHKSPFAMALLATVTVDSLQRNIEHASSERFRSHCGLHQFVLLKKADMTRILLESGSPVDAKDPESQDTALHLAAEQLDVEHVKLLLEFNADVNAKGQHGQTPLARIPVKKDEEQAKALTIVKALMAAGATLIDRTNVYDGVMARQLFSSGNREIIRFLLQDRVDLKYEESYMWTTLCALASNKEPEVLAEVPNLGSAMKVRNHAGTMLHVAAFYLNFNAMTHLLDNGADIDAEGDMGTPFDIVTGTFRRFEKYDDTLHELLNCIEMLLERGARPRLNRRNLYVTGWPIRVKDKYVPLLEPVVAYLAVREAFAQPIDELSYANIESCPQLKSMFSRKIGRTLTLIDFFYASDRQLVFYARIQSLIRSLTEAMKECNSDSYWHRKLRQRFANFTRMVEARTKLITIINDCFETFHNVYVNNVTEKIVDCLKNKELYEISSICD